MAGTGQAELLAVVFAVTVDGATEVGLSWSKWLLERAVAHATSISAVVDSEVDLLVAEAFLEYRQRHTAQEE